MLLAAGLDPPQRIITHGHFTVDRQKMSKSAGNVLHPRNLIETFGLEPFRFFILWSGSLHTDGDFSEELARLRINADLSNQFGNLLTRSASPSINHHGHYPRRPDLSACFEGESLASAEAFADSIDRLSSTVDKMFEWCEFRTGIEEIFKVLHTANQFFQNESPWKLAPKPNLPSPSPSDLERLDAIVYLVFESFRVSSILLQPIIPNASSAVLDKFSVPSDRRTLSDARFGLHASHHAIPMPQQTPILFPRMLKEDPIPPPSSASTTTKKKKIKSDRANKDVDRKEHQSKKE